LHASCEVLPRRTKLEAPNRSCNMALGIYNAEAMSSQRPLSSLICAGFGILLECGTFLRSSVRSRSSLIAENLFLRKQLAFYKEHQVRPRRLTDSARISLVLWSKLCDWRSALVIVKPETLISWHRRGFKLFWQLKSRVGRPRLPSDIRQLIARMVEENPTWGQARVADELALKLGILVSPRTVRAYWPKQPDRRGPRPTCSQPWQTFVRNHAQSLLACDFLVVVTARFRLLYVFVLMEIDTRKILQCKVTAHPAAAWTLQQFREALPSDHENKLLIHDRDSIFSTEVDAQLRSFGLKSLKTPVRAPKANAHCERLIGTIRREFLDFVIPLGERHLRRLMREWVAHYNQARPHSSLGPGTPEGIRLVQSPQSGERHILPHNVRVLGRPILGGLHHEYGSEKVAA
jgi:putative transposase